MQVKISYTAELGDVPREVSNILKSIELELDKSRLDLEHAFNTLNLNELSDSKVHMNLFKTKLQKMFVRLSDCQIVLEDYENVLNQQQVPKPSLQQDKPIEE
jgi:hypothetical protein